MSWFARPARHEAEKLAALNRSQAIIEFAPDGTILSANENFCKTLGYTPEELQGQHHRLFVEPAHAQSEDYRAFWSKLGGGAFDSGIYKRMRKDGSYAYIRATYNPVLGSNGQVISILKVAADVTQTRLKSLENEAVIAALSRVQALISFKPNGEILEANDNFFSVMGYRRADVIGKHHRMFVDPAFASSPEYADFWKRLNAGESIVDSFHRLGAGGKRVWLQASYSPVFDADGRLYKIVKFAYDITDLLMLGDGLARMSNGDLSQPIDRAFASTFEKLRRDFNTAVEHLAEALRGIAEARDIADSSAQEIASASQDLSQRTESQAANLEQTAAALEQVTSTVKKATESARLANQVVGEAKTDAEKSGVIVGRAVDAMGRLENSSREIGKIIGVIDEIAFQTNLLALNAGVEAARAGEAGRGFAVVATEVRALAGRSADAAKQIKTLVSTSGADVEAGVKLVRQTGEALGAIVGKVMQINGLVGDIAGAAEEQSNALGEVNSAVGQMDQSTQQNAAMAEQANAAAETMRQQIGRLGEAVGNFRLGGGAGARRSRAA